MLWQRWKFVWKNIKREHSDARRKGLVVLSGKRKGNKSFRWLDKIEFLFNSGRASMLGHRFVNEKRFKEALRELRSAIDEDMKMAESEEIRKKEEAINYIKELDPYKESRLLAEKLLENSKIESDRMIEEAELIRENLIKNGEKTRETLIEEGYSYIEKNLDTALESVHNSYLQLDKAMTDLNGFNETDAETKGGNKRVS